MQLRLISNRVAKKSPGDILGLPTLKMTDQSEASDGILFRDFDIPTITVNILVIVSGLLLLVLRKHSWRLWRELAPTVPGLFGCIAIHSRLDATSTVRAWIIACGSGLVIGVLGWGLFYIVPCMGPSCILSMLLLCIGVLSECSVGYGYSIFLESLPIFAGFVLTLIIYGFARVRFLRRGPFEWPESVCLNSFHIFLTCLSASFCVISPMMYFASSDHSNLLSIVESAIGANIHACDSDSASIGLAAWLAAFFLSVFTRTPWFDKMILWIPKCVGIRLPRRSAQSQRRGLIRNQATAPPTEFGIRNGTN